MHSTNLFSRRFVLFSGKGGVGRTTVAAAFAVCAAKRGKKVLLCQMDAPAGLEQLLGQTAPIGPAVTAINENLWAVNLTPRESLHEYVVMTLRSETLYKALFENRAAQGFLTAVPGLDDYSMLGKAWFHTTPASAKSGHRFDLVVMDAPPSGHCTSILRIPQSILDAMPLGPLAEDARAMIALFRDPEQSAFVPVTLAEELPCRETVEMVNVFRDQLHLPVPCVIANAVPDPRFASPALMTTLETWRRRPVGNPDLAATLTTASLFATRRKDAAAVLAGLKSALSVPVFELPRLPLTRIRPEDLAPLAAQLDSLSDLVT